MAYCVEYINVKYFSQDHKLVIWGHETGTSAGGNKHMLELDCRKISAQDGEI